MLEVLTEEQKSFMEDLEEQADKLDLGQFYTKIRELSLFPVKEFLAKDLNQFPKIKEALIELSKTHVLIINTPNSYNYQNSI
jgi:hypothetical protein